jgi:hypothetical protein
MDTCPHCGATNLELAQTGNYISAYGHLHRSRHVLFQYSLTCVCGWWALGYIQDGRLMITKENEDEC